MVVTLLAGGTGGAKLAVGLRDLLHGTPDRPAARPGKLNVIANTGDDIEIYDVHVSPDPDLITFRLAGVIDDQGFGVAGESHSEMDARRAAGERIWFELGDDDLAVCRERAALLAAGAELTEAHARATAAYDTGGAVVLPMTDDAVRTVIQTPGGARGLQQYLIEDHSEPAIDGVEFVGASDAQATAQATAAIAEADLIVIGPSNPVISIGPILAVPGIREAMGSAAAPVLAVSPFVGGQVLKGPTAKFLTAAGVTADISGAAGFYGELIDAWISDEPVDDFAHYLADVRMSDAAEQRSVAADVLLYGRSLAPTATSPAS